MFVICLKDNKAVVNSGYTIVCFKINDPLKMLPCYV